MVRSGGPQETDPDRGVLSLLLLFPIFWGIGALANPGLRDSAREAPVMIAGAACDYNPFADDQATDCGKLLQEMTSLGVPYSVEESATPPIEGSLATLVMNIGSAQYDLSQGVDLGGAERKAFVQSLLQEQGYSFERQTPPMLNIIGIIALLLCLGGLSALTYGSVAALLAEMFPAKIRYSSMSIPYHIGAGYLGGFLPLIAAYIVATTGNAYAGLWYTWVIVAFGLVVAWWGIQDGPPRDFDENG